MKTETITALTPLDLCTLIAHETVSLLNADTGALETAAQLREGLTILAAAKGLTDDAGDLLAWRWRPPGSLLTRGKTPRP